MTEIGTREWGLRTQGRLRPREKLLMVSMVMRAMQRDMAERFQKNSRMHREKLNTVNFDAVPLPDSLLVQQTIEKAQDAYGGKLRLHCYRTYWWGALLAQFDAVKFDPELLMVASLLHDLGIAPDGAPVSKTCCFSVMGGQLAESFLIEKGYDARKAVIVNDAINTHLNPVVQIENRSVEAKLLSQGATLDVTGARSCCVPDRLLHMVDQRYPREGFIAEFANTGLKAEHPAHTRPEFLKWGFRKMALRNRLDRM